MPRDKPIEEPLGFRVIGRLSLFPDFLRRSIQGSVS